MICQKCGKTFPVRVKIDGKIKNLCSRKFCLDCSPFGLRNTKQILAPTVSGEKCCLGCNKSLIENKNNFYTKGERFYARCKKCFNTLCKKQSQEVKKKAIEYMGGKCFICGYNRCNAALELHHKNPKEKDPKIKFGSTRRSFDKIKKELDKCVLLCANCHREEHVRLRGICPVSVVDAQESSKLLD